MLSGGGGSSQVEGFAIAVDDDGNSHITGWYRGQATFGSTVLPSVIARRVFVSKLNSQGGFLWTLGGMSLTEAGLNSYVTKFGPDGNFISATVGPGGHLTTDGLGNVWVTSSFSGTIEIAGETYVAASSNSLYLAKLITGTP